MNNIKLFEEYNIDSLLPSDKLRIELIEKFFEDVKSDPDHNTEVPEMDLLIDDWDGYEWQTYIQNDLENNQIIYYEGWVSACWEGLYSKDEYKGLSKTEAIEKMMKERVPIIAEKLNLEIISHNYWTQKSWTEGVKNAYITKIIFKTNL